MHVQTNEQYEDIVWNQKRFPKPAFFRAMRGLNPEKRELEIPGFLLTKGNYGKLLIGPVHHDGDIYRRACRQRGSVFGSASLLKKFGMDEADLFSEQQIIEMVLIRADYKRLKRHSDGKVFDVAMLSEWPDPQTRPRACAIYLADGIASPLNPELSSRHNQSDVRFDIVHPLADGLLEQSLKQRLQ